MANIVRLSPKDRDRLIAALANAADTGKSVRICTGRDSYGPGNWVKWDIGNTGWTPPYYTEEF